jgi:polysaccharide biosynthesis/export protein
LGISAEQTRCLRGLLLVFSLLWTPHCVAAHAFHAFQSAAAPDATSGKGKAAKATPATAASANSDDATTYRIGVEDELAISVWKEPELSQTVTVRPDGKITLPLVDEVSVVGLKTDELQDILTAKFKPFVNEPQVTVSVRTIRSRKVYIVGKALKQGTFQLNGRTTVLQLLADAGGLTPFAKTGSIYIVRKQGDKETKIPFNYKKALAGQSDDPVLMPGDMVVIP